MDIPTLKVAVRKEKGRRVCNRLRREGRVPGVMYGRGKGNIMLTLDTTDIEQLLDSHTLVFQVESDSEQTPVQLLAVQYDSLGDEIVHVDLGRISMTETVEVAVAVETKGDPIGVREEGGILEVIQHDVIVESLPGSIPEKILIDVADMSIGDDVRIGELDLPEGVSAIDDDDAVVVTCVPPMEMVTEEDEEMLETDVMAEPEVIGREEEEDEEDFEEGEEPAETEEE